MLERIFNLQDRARTIVLAITVATVVLVINEEIADKTDSVDKRRKKDAVADQAI